MDKVKVFLIAVIIILSAGGFYYGQKLRNDNKKLLAQIVQLQNPQVTANEEVAALVAKVGKLVVLPQNEQPVVATVTDISKLKDQPAFANAQNGDKILIYTNEKKAYLYDPAKNVIVDVIPVNIGQNAMTISGVDANHPLRVALVNGSKNTGVTNTLATRIADAKIAGVSVVSKATAKSSDYANTQVIDLTGKWGSQAAQFAQMVSGVVATSSSETKPANADLLVIIGADYK